MTRIVPPISHSRIQKTDRKDNSKGSPLKIAMKTVSDAIISLTQAPLPTPNMFEWKEEWAQMSDQFNQDMEDKKPGKDMATKSDLRALRTAINVYLFARINLPSGDVLKPLMSALCASDIKAATANVKALLN